MSLPETVSSIVSKTVKSVKKRVKPIVMWLGRKLRLTLNPMPRRRLARLTALLLLPYVPSLMPSIALANPTGGKVVSGTATITQTNPNTVKIDQTTPKVALDWNKFSIARGESVIFNQPSTSSVALNRVLGGNPSEIFGSLSANGHVFLINQAGVLFAPGANVNVGGLVGSTLSMSNADFNAGNYRFSKDGNAGSVINRANLTANGGSIALIGPKVVNEGVVSANQGSVAFGAGDKVTLSYGSSGMVNIKVDAAAVAASIDNKGQVYADGGQVQFTARSADAVLDTVINSSGIVRANSMIMRDGKIVLDGGPRGVVQVSGTLQAKGEQAGTRGGEIKVLGDKVGLFDQARVDVSGQAGGGTVLVGGNYQGKGVEANASFTHVSEQVSIKADALEKGDGGKVILWADQQTNFLGDISAKGGVLGGNGGFVETSGKEILQVLGNVNASAAQGKGGTWLLDPNNIAIQNVASNTNVTGSFSSTGDSAIVSASKLGNALTNGTSVTVLTGVGGANSQAGNISVEAAVTATGSNATLNLEARGDISFTSSGKLSGTNLNVNLKAGSNSSHVPGSVASTITMANGSGISTSGGNVNATAKGAIVLAGINTGSGNLTVDSNDGSISQSSALTVSGAASFDAGTGMLTLNNSANSIATVGSVTATGGNFSFVNTRNLTFGGSVNVGSNAIDINNGNTDVSLGANSFTSVGLHVKSRFVNVSSSTLSGVTGTIHLEPFDAAADITLANSASTADFYINNGIAKLNASGATNVIIGAVGGTGNLTIDNDKSADFGARSLTLNAGSISNTAANTIIANGVTLNANSNNADIGALGNRIVIAATSGSKVSVNTKDGNAYLNLGSGSGEFAASNLGGGTLDVSSSVAISQSGVITANTLTVSNSQATNLGSKANLITNLGAVANTGGDFSLQTSAGLKASGAINVGANALTINAGSDTLNFNNATLTATGTTTLQAKDVSFTGTTSIAGVTGTLNLKPNAIGDSIGLAGGAGDFNLDATDLSKLSAVGAAAVINIGETSGKGAVTLGGAVNLGTRNVTINGGSFANSGSGQTITAGTLNLNATGGSIGASGSGAISVNTSTSLAVNTTGNKDAFLTTAGGFTLDKSSVGTGTLDLSPSGGGVSQNGVLTAGTLTITGATANVNLNAANVISHIGTVTAPSKTVTINNSQALDQTGVINADTLNISTSSGKIDLSSQNNLISNLGLVSSANDFALKTTTAPTITQDISATGHKVSLETTGAGTLTLGKHAVDATDLTLKAASVDLTNTTLTNVTGTISLQPQAIGKSIGLAGATADFEVNTATLGILKSSNASSIEIGISGGTGTLTTGDIVDLAGKNLTLNAGSYGESKAAGNIISAANLTLKANGGADIGATGTGAIDIAATGSVKVTTTGSAFLNSASDLKIGQSSVTGTLDLNAGGALSQSGAITAGTLAISNSSNSSDFGMQDNAISNLGKIDVSGQTVSIKNTAVLGNTGVITAGTLNIENTKATTLNQANAISKLGTVTQSGGDFSLTNSAADLTANGNISATGQNVTINTGSKAFAFGNVTVTADKLDVTSTGVTQSGALTLSAPTTLTAGKAAVELTNSGNVFNQALNVTNTGSNAVKITSGGDLVLGAINTGNNLEVIAAGNVSQSAAATVVGTTQVTINTGMNKDVTLDKSANNFTGAISISNGTGSVRDVSIANAHSGAAVLPGLPAGVRDLTLNFPNSAVALDGTANISRNLSVTAGGDITQSAALTIVGTTTLDAGAHDVTLASSNDFQGAVSVIAANAKFNDSNALTLGTSTVSGTLDLTSGAAIGQTGIISTDILTISNKSGDILLNMQPNKINKLGAIDATGKTFSLQNDTALTQVSSTQIVADTFNLTNTAATNLPESNAISNLGTVTNKGGSFVLAVDNALTAVGAIDATGQDVTINTRADGFKFGNGFSIAAKSLLLETSGITQDASLTLDAPTTIHANLGAVVLTDTGNKFNSTLEISNSGGKAVSLTSVAGLSLSNISTDGDLTLISAGNVAQNGGSKLTVAGNTKLTLNTNPNLDVTLGESGNSFTGTVTIENGTGSARDISISNSQSKAALATFPNSGLRNLTLNYPASAVTLADTTLAATGNLNITAGGDVSTGVLVVPGTTTVSAAGHTVTLDKSNSLTGAVSVTASDASVNNSGALVLGKSGVSGTLTLNASGAISEIGAITANTLVLSNTADTDLTGATNVITHLGTISASGKSFSLKNSTALDQTGIITAGTLAIENTALTDLSGKTNVISNLGAITQSGGDFKLNNQGTALTLGGTIAAGSNNVSIDTGSKALTFGNVGITANSLTVTSTGVDQSGALTLDAPTTLNAGAGAVALTQAGNVLNKSLTISNSGANPVAITSSGALELGAITTANDLTVIAKGNVTQSAASTVGGATSVTIDTATNADVLLGKANDFKGAITIGVANSGTVHDVSLNNIHVGDFAATLPASLNNLTLTQTNGAVNLSPGATLNDLTVTAGGNITQSGGALIIKGDATLNAGAHDITLFDPANNFKGTVIANGANVKLLDVDALKLGTSTITGTLDISAGDAVSQSGPLVVTGLATISLTKASDISLGDAGNDFKGGISFPTLGNNIDLANSNASATLPMLPASLNNLSLNFTNADIALPTLKVTGTLSVTGKSISQQANATITSNTSSFTAKTGTIALTNDNNDFTGAVQLTTSSTNAAIKDGDALKLDTSSVGSLNVTSGTLTQGGALKVTGATVLDTGSADLTLSNSTNSFGGTVTITAANNASLVNNGALSLGASKVAGALALTTNAGLTQSGALTVGTTTTVTLDTTANQDVTLTQNNDFTGKLTIATANGGTAQDINVKNIHTGDANIVLPTSLRDLTLTQTNGGVALSPSTTIRDLNVTAGGNITSSSDLSITGTTTLDAGTTKSITLNGNNSFGKDVSIVHANDATLKASGALSLGTSTIANNLSLTAGGHVSQSGALVVGGTTGVTLTTNTSLNVDLMNKGNDLTGMLTIGTSSGGSVQNISILNAHTGPANVMLPGGLNDLTLSQPNGAVTLSGASLTGNLDVTAGGKIDQGGALTVAGTTKLAAGSANDIALTKSNDFQGAVTITSGNNVSLTDANKLDLGTSTVSGALAVTAGGALSQSGALSVAGTASFDAAGNTVTLNSANDFSKAVALKGSTVSITDTNALDLGSSTVTGNLTVNVSGNLTQSNALSVGGTTSINLKAGTPDVTLAHASNDFTGNISVNNSGGNVHDVSLSNSHAGAASFTLASGINNLTLNQSKGAVTLAGTSLSGNLDVSAGGKIDQTGVLTVAGTTKLAAGSGNDIVLTKSNDFQQAVTISSGNNVSLTDANKLDLGTGTVSGTLAVIAGGAISQSGAITVAGTASFDATGNSITLTSANDFSKAVTLKGSTVSIADSNALDLGSSSVTGNLSVDISGNLTQSNALTVGGTTSINVKGGTPDVTLAHASNDFTGNVSVNNSGGNVHDVSLTNNHLGAADFTLASGINNLTLNQTRGALTLSGTSLSGNLDVTAGGKIDQLAALTVAGSTKLTAGSGNDISLTKSNDFQQAVTVVSGNNVSLTDANKLDLGASTISGKLNIIAGGALSQSGALSVTGATDIDATGQSVTLTLGNDFKAGVALKGSDVSIADTNTLALDSSTVSHDLTLNISGNLSQNAALTVGNNTTVNIKAGSRDITLTTAGNDLTGTVAIVNDGGTANNVSLTNNHAGAASLSLPGNVNNLTIKQTQGAVSLPGTIVAGALDVTAGGAIDQTNPLTVSSTTTLNAGSANAITLSKANDFKGAVTITSAKDVTLTDSNSLILGAATVAGNLLVTTTGGLTQTAALNVQGTTSIDANGNSITLTKNNDFVGALSLKGSSADVTDSYDLLLAGSSVSGALTLNIGGNLTQNAGLSVGGATTVNLNTNKNLDVTLDNKANDFTGTVSVLNGTGTAQNVSLTNNHGTATSIVLPGSVNNLTLKALQAGITLPGVSVAGTLDVSAAGTIDQSGILTVTKGATLAAGVGNDISLTKSNDFQSAVIISSARDVDLKDSNALDLGLSSITRNLVLNAGGAVTQSGTLSVGGTTTLSAAGKTITLGDTSNDFTGSVAVTGSDVTLSDKNALVLDASSVSGNLALNVGGNLSQNAAVTVAGTTTVTLNGSALDVTLDKANDFTGKISINKGTGTAHDVSVTNTHMGDANIVLPTGLNNLTLTQTKGAVDLSTAVLGGNLSVTAGGNISQNGAITVAGTTTLDAGTTHDITLVTSGNHFSKDFTIVNGNNVSVKDSGALVLAASTVSGNLDLTTGGAITQNGNLTVSGTSKLNAGSSDITLTQSGNDFKDAVGITANNVTLTDVNALKLAASQISGNLILNLGGNLTQSGALSVGGTTTLNLNNGALDITLNDDNNDFSKNVAVVNAGGTAHDVSLSNKHAAAADITLPGTLNQLTIKQSNGAVTLPALNLTGTLSVTAGGAIGQADVLTVAGATTLDAGSNAISLTKANDFQSDVTVLHGSTVSLTDANALSLGNVSATDLTIASTGTLTQSKASVLTISGKTSLNSGASDITLANSGNDFQGDVALATTASATLRDTNGLSLGSSNVGTNLTLTLGGDLTQSKAITVGATTTVTSEAAGGLNVILSDVGNDLNDQVNILNGISGKVSNINITNTHKGASFLTLPSGLNDLTLKYTQSSIQLSKSTLLGNLDVTSSGDISQTGPLVVHGTTTLDAGTTHDITLGFAGNDFTKEVQIRNGRDVTLSYDQGLLLGNSTISRNLVVNAGAGVTQNGAVTVGGNYNLTAVGAVAQNGTLAVTGNLEFSSAALSQTAAISVTGTSKFNAGSNAIDLSNSSNDFSNAVTFTGGDVTLVDKNAIVFAGGTATGKLNLTAGGNVSQTGALNITGDTSLTTTAAAVNIDLSHTDNKLGPAITVAQSGAGTLHDLSLRNSNAGITLGSVPVTGALTLKADGDITQASALSVTGASSIDAATHAITLTQANDFVGAVGLTAATVDLKDSNLLVLGSSTVTGAVKLVSSGNISQTAAVDFGAASDLNAGSGNITLAHVDNKLTGAVKLNTSGNVDLNDVNALVLDASTVGGSLSVKTAGNLSQTGTLNVTGATNITVDKNTVDVLLAFKDVGKTVPSDNNLIGVVTVATTNGGKINAFELNNISTTASTLNLPATLDSLTLNFAKTGLILGGDKLLGTTVAHDVSITTGGNIGQSAALHVGGTAKFDAGSFALELKDSGNTFTGEVDLKGGSNVTISAASNLNFSAINVSNGPLTITTTGNVTQTGAIKQGGAGDSKISASNITLTNAGNLLSGPLSLNAGNIEVVNSAPVTLAASTIGHDLSITANGNITQTAALNVSGNAKFFANGSANVSLGEFANDFGGTITIGGSGLNDVTLRNAHSGASTLLLPDSLNNLKLTYDNSGIVLPDTTLRGSLEATANGDITQVGRVNVPGTTKLTAIGHAIKLDQTGNDFGGALSLNATGGGEIAITDANNLVFADSILGSGKLTVIAGADITQTGSIIQGAAADVTSFTSLNGAITLDKATNHFTGAVGLNSSGVANVALTNDGALILGESKLGNGLLSVIAVGDITQKGAITQGTASKGASFTAGNGKIALDNVGNDFNGGLKLSNSGANDVTVVDLNALQLDEIRVGSGKFSATGKAGITQSGTIEQTGAGEVKFSAETGAIVIDKANKLLGAVSLSQLAGNDVTLNNTGALTLATVNVGTGKLNVKAQGDITQGDAGSVVQGANAQAATFESSSGAIRLNKTANDFTGAVTLKNSGNNAVELVDANDLKLGASTVGTGTLTINAGGNISQSGGLVQGTGSSVGAVSITAGTTAAPKTITLDSADNDFAGSVSMNGGNSKINDKTALVFGASNINGTLDASATGMTQSDALVVSGAAKLSVGTGSIVLNKSNDFNSLDLKAASADITDRNALVLSGKLTADLNVRSSGALTQTAALVVGGNATLNAGSNAITLNTAGNDFNKLSATGSAIAVTDSNALTLGTAASGNVSVNSAALTFTTSTVGGSLTATTSGAVGQTGTLTVTGASSFNAGSNAVTLEAANDFKDVVNVSNSGAANAVSIVDAKNLKLGNVKTDGELKLSAQGLSQDAAGITVGGKATLNAGAGTLVLNNAKNDFVGSVALSNSGANAVSLSDANALQLGAVNLGSGDAAIKAAGAITQVDAFKTSGKTSFDAGSNAVTLSNTGNSFTGKVNVSSSSADLVAAGKLDLELQTSGNATVAAGDISIGGKTGGNLKANANATISQSTGLKVAGSTDLTSGGALSLNRDDNEFTGAVKLQATDAVLHTASNLNFSSKANTVTLVGGKAIEFGVNDIANSLNFTAGGKFTVAKDGVLNVPNLTLNLIAPTLADQDFGSLLDPILIDKSTQVTVLSAHLGFFKIPFAAQTKFDVTKLPQNTGACIRVNGGACRNGNELVSGAISSVQSSAVSGLNSKLAKEDALTKKLKYGFAGDLQQAQSFPHGGALEVKSYPSAGPRELAPKTGTVTVTPLQP